MVYHNRQCPYGVVTKENFSHKGYTDTKQYVPVRKKRDRQGMRGIFIIYYFVDKAKY